MRTVLWFLFCLAVLFFALSIAFSSTYFGVMSIAASMIAVVFSCMFEA